MDFIMRIKKNKCKLIDPYNKVIDEFKTNDTKNVKYHFENIIKKLR